MSSWPGGWRCLSSKVRVAAVLEPLGAEWLDRALAVRVVPGRALQEAWAEEQAGPVWWMLSQSQWQWRCVSWRGVKRQLFYLANVFTRGGRRGPLQRAGSEQLAAWEEDRCWGDAQS